MTTGISANTPNSTGSLVGLWVILATVVVVMTIGYADSTAEQQKLSTDWAALEADEKAIIARIAQRDAMLAKSCAASPSCVADANAFRERITEQAAERAKWNAYLNSKRQSMVKLEGQAVRLNAADEGEQL